MPSWLRRIKIIIIIIKEKSHRKKEDFTNLCTFPNSCSHKPFPSKTNEFLTYIYIYFLFFFSLTLFRNSCPFLEINSQCLSQNAYHIYLYLCVSHDRKFFVTRVSLTWIIKGWVWVCICVSLRFVFVLIWIHLLSECWHCVSTFRSDEKDWRPCMSFWFTLWGPAWVHVARDIQLALCYDWSCFWFLLGPSLCHTPLPLMS